MVSPMRMRAMSTSTTTFDAPFRLPRTADYVDFICDAAGPILQILAPLSPAVRDAAWTDITTQLDAFQTAEGWIGPNTLLLTVGTR